MILIQRKTFASNLLLKTEIKNVNPVNQMQEAETTPVIKGTDCSAGRVTRKAPSIIVPSMIACGLNHVTTQADNIVLPMESSV